MWKLLFNSPVLISFFCCFTPHLKLAFASRQNQGNHIGEGEEGLLGARETDDTVRTWAHRIK